MFNLVDEKKEIALTILRYVCDLPVSEVVRYPNGYCHSVYFAQAGAEKYVLRVTNESEKQYYMGALQWLPQLENLGIPAPKIVKNGRYEDVYFCLITFIPGDDIGNIYDSLSKSQKRNIARDIAEIQKKVALLPTGHFYGYTADEVPYSTWADFLNSQIQRSQERLAQNGVWGTDICDILKAQMNDLQHYLSTVRPTAFLGDITTKNVLVQNGKLSGIVDVDEICYGDSLLVVGLTHMALLAAEADTDYTAYWLEEMNPGAEKRKAVELYTLLFCVDFMSEQGMRFGNGNSVPVNPKTIAVLNRSFAQLCQIGQKKQTNY